MRQLDSSREFGAFYLPRVIKYRFASRVGTLFEEAGSVFPALVMFLPRNDAKRVRKTVGVRGG